MVVIFLTRTIRPNPSAKIRKFCGNITRFWKNFFPNEIVFLIFPSADLFLKGQNGVSFKNRIYQKKNCSPRLFVLQMFSYSPLL